MIQAQRKSLMKCIVLLILANCIMYILIKRKSQSLTGKMEDSGMIKRNAVRLNHPSFNGDDVADIILGVDARKNLHKFNISNQETNYLHDHLIKIENKNRSLGYTETNGSQFVRVAKRRNDDGRQPQSGVVNPHDFAMLINEPRKCMNDSGGTKPVFLLVLVLTAHKNFRLRRAVRETWGSVTEVNGENIITLFLLGRTKMELHERAVTQESLRFSDIIMEDFVDSYKNLTLKVIMGFKWATKFCSQANYIMKTDDDMFVSYENLVRYLRSSKTPSSRFVTGRTIQETLIRDPKNKWYVPTSVYKGSMLPPFCSGTGYVMSGDVAPMVAMTSLYIPYLHLEDVFVGLCLERLGIRPRRHIQFNNGNVKYSYCRYKTVFTAHLSVAFVEVIYEIWKDLNTPKSFHCNIPFWPGNDPLFF